MEYLATKQMIKYPESRGPSIFLHKSYLGRSNGLCSQGNDKDTWKGAQRECTTSRGDLVKVDDDNQKRFLIHFMEVTGLKKMKIDVSTESWTLLSPKTEQHEFFLLTSVRYKTELGHWSEFWFRVPVLNWYFAEFCYHESILKDIIPKNYINIFWIFLVTYQLFFSHFDTKTLWLFLKKNLQS